jgi:hypothetical protein
VPPYRRSPIKVNAFFFGRALTRTLLTGHAPTEPKPGSGMVEVVVAQ